MDNIIAKLDELAVLRAEQSTIQQIYADRRAAIMAPVLATVKDELAALDAEQAALHSPAAAIAQLEAEIESAVIAVGASVKGNALQAVFSKARRSVNMDKFDGYCVTHPEAAALIETGKPNVSFRAIAGKKKE